MLPGLVSRSACAATFMLAATAAGAQTPPKSWTSGMEDMRVDLSIGTLNGHGREYVLNPDGSSMSMLRWDMRNIAMFNAAVAYRPLSWLALELRGVTNLSGSSHMDDYDWNISQCPPVSGGGTYCESNHADTVLRNAWMLDAFAAARFLSTGSVHLSAIAGYKHDFYRWQATGSVSNYAPPSVASSISYDQSWRAPYVGIGIDAEHGPWSLRGRLIASVWASSTSKDIHHNRATLFVDRTGPSQMMAAELGVGYRLSRSLILTLDYRYQAWRLSTGRSTWIDAIAGTTSSSGPKGAGAANTSHMLAIGLSTRPLSGGRPDGGPPADSRWGGLHAGAEIGWLWQSATWRTLSYNDPPVPAVAETATVPLNSGAARAGLFAGYDTRLGERWVAGIEADLGFAGANHTTRGVPGTNSPAQLAASADAARVMREWDASLRLRLGLLLRPDLLVYASGGLALERQGSRLDCKTAYGGCIGQPAEREEKHARTLAGWTAGVGAELALTEGWFARAEYRYSAVPVMRHRFFADSAASVVDTAVARHNHRIGVGLGYRW